MRVVRAIACVGVAQVSRVGVAQVFRVGVARAVACMLIAGCGRIGFGALGDDAITDDAAIDDARSDAGDTCAIADLVAYYPFDERSGTVAHDASGNSNDATTVDFATPYWVGGHTDFSLLFTEGVPNRVESESAAFDDLPQITICSWVFAEVPSESFMTIADKSLDGFSGGWNFYIRSDNDAFGLFTNMGGFVEATGREFGVWQYLCGTWSGAADAASVDLYVDGSPAVPNVTRGGTPPRQSDAAHPFVIGRGPGGIYPYAGRLDELRVYNRALSSSEIAALYACVL